MRPVPDGVYDFWYFDEESGSWQQQGSADAQVNPQQAANNQEIAKLSRQLPAKPIKPVAFDNAKPSLNFELDYSEFPDLKEMKGIVWQYAGADKKVDPAQNLWIFEKEWTNIKLKDENTAGQYRLTLSDGHDTYSIPVVPSQKKADYEAAFVKYQADLKSFDAMAKAIQEKEALRNQQAAFLRSFRVQNFGIHNYDILAKSPQNLPLAANFEFDGLPDVMKENAVVYLITGDKRMVIKFPHYSWNRFAFDPKADNKLIAILPGNMMAVYSQEDFKKNAAELKSKRGEAHTFKMKVMDQPIESMADIYDQAKKVG